MGGVKLCPIVKYVGIQRKIVYAKERKNDFKREKYHLKNLSKGQI